mmetsp:Transcript_7823/g.19508  ORF Transcript_7823/g.19508 Transcript_7823/m.19508 type:complete len:191 (+) Transcript_7823:135-707(+)|eukprot:CAMPEP_0113454154 /NCGR_PEP_ID=MMETSP0014_2-20120614/7719_1 /TAXON_ID=2857 /ORGANISM="Nitzschia sp." /LENGTH=190 /DNA_ID=CAMNT_0000345555 /DNA_START=463 /DNA_END=1035 /DNA_ORIENTATION=+ /assembly_acc=CAM_ASM_000159
MSNNTKAVGPSPPSGSSGDGTALRDFSKKSVVEKLLTPNLQPKFEELPELVDYIYYIRGALAALYGIWIQYGRSENLPAQTYLMFAFNTVCFVPLAYTITYLRVDQESYGASLLFTGVPQGMALIMLIWIYMYTQSHETDEMAFANALLGSVGGGTDNVIGDETDDGSSSSSSSGATSDGTESASMESEF